MSVIYKSAEKQCPLHREKYCYGDVSKILISPSP